MCTRPGLSSAHLCTVLSGHLSVALCLHIQPAKQGIQMSCGTWNVKECRIHQMLLLGMSLSSARLSELIHPGDSYLSAELLENFCGMHHYTFCSTCTRWTGFPDVRAIPVWNFEGKLEGDFSSLFYKMQQRQRSAETTRDKFRHTELEGP